MKTINPKIKKFNRKHEKKKNYTKRHQTIQNKRQKGNLNVIKRKEIYYIQRNIDKDEIKFVMGNEREEKAKITLKY